MSERKRKQLTLKDKCEIIAKIKSGVSRKQIIIDHNIKNRSHLTKILKNENKITAAYESLNKKSAKTASRVRGSNYPKVEEVLTNFV